MYEDFIGWVLFLYCYKALFLGLPIFPGACEYDLLLFIEEKLGYEPSSLFV